MAELGKTDLEPPRWFLDALDTPADNGSVVVGGARIRFRAWGCPGGPGLVLVHGGAAHARWWDHVGPLLTERGERRVVALDLSGHGDSDPRERYSLDQWSDEVIAAAEAGMVGGPPVLVGHSMGGIVAYVAAGRYAERLAGVVMIDSPIRERTPEEEAARRKSSFGPKKIYPSVDEARAHFRLVPQQDRVLDFVEDHIAETSLRQEGDGWCWKFDPAMFGRGSSAAISGDLARCRLGYLRAENGIIPDTLMTQMQEMFGAGAVVAELPEAGHHAMIDQPLPLTVGIRAIVAAWDAADRVAGVRAGADGEMLSGRTE